MKALFVIILSFNSYAHMLGKPIMATAILKKANTKLKAHKCHEIGDIQKKVLSSREITNSVNTDYFMADVECEYKCGKRVKTGTITERFDPESLGLSAGDGTSDQKIIWRSLGTTLDVWSKKKCYQLASKKCKRVKDFKVKKISSGNWSHKGEYNCQRTDVVYSPFDEQFKLNNKGKAHYNDFLELYDYDSPGYDQPSPLSNYLPKGLKSKDVQKYILEEGQADCKNKAMVSTCFGDCIFQKDNNSSWNEVLLTNEYYGDYKLEICMDSFEKQFKAQTSKAGKDLVCHKLIWEIFRRANITGVSCAAFRYDYQCPNFN